MSAYDSYDVQVLLTAGPERVVFDDPPPERWKPPRYVGFLKPVVEPLTWEGDNA